MHWMTANKKWNHFTKRQLSNSKGKLITSGSSIKKKVFLKQMVVNCAWSVDEDYALNKGVKYYKIFSLVVTTILQISF